MRLGRCRRQRDLGVRQNKWLQHCVQGLRFSGENDSDRLAPKSDLASYKQLCERGLWANVLRAAAPDIRRFIDDDHETCLMLS